MHTAPQFRSLLRRKAWALAVAAVAVLLVLVVLAASRHRGSGTRAFRVRVTANGEMAPKPLPGGLALQFADSYLAFLYGRVSAASVTPITSALRARLTGGRSLSPPAELQRELIVRGVQVTRTGLRTTAARTVVDDGASPPNTLTFNLRLIGGRWLVTSVRGGP
jgi:hypothetical protein